jgi:pimeloyl-ACP methyl ester carboxylesterase
MALFGCSIQDRLLYYPDRYEPSALARLARAGLAPWPSAEGYRGFLAAAPRAAAGGTLVVFHGNAGSAADRRYYLPFLRFLGFRIILLEYPGYGARSGRPGETALVADGAESLRKVLEEYGRPVYVLGESLGAAVAAGAIARSGVPVDGLVLCTPWDNLPTVARALYGFLPVDALIRDRYDSVAYLEAYRGPLAVVAADRDELIPQQASARLFDAYGGPKAFWTVPGTHNTWLGSTDPAWWRQVFEALKETAGDRVPAGPA